MNQRTEIIRLIPKNAGKILDVGCSTGDVGLSIKKKIPCEVTGIEIDNDKAKIAATKIDKVLIGDAGNMFSVLKDNYFDCIIFADVLEHLRYPCDILKRYSNYLKEGGRFVISIPNVRHLEILFNLVMLGEWKYQPYGIMDESHLRFFTFKSFKRLMNDAGILPISVGRIFSIKGSRMANSLTLGIFKDFFTAQYVFLAKKR